MQHCTALVVDSSDNIPLLYFYNNSLKCNTLIWFRVIATGMFVFRMFGKLCSFGRHIHIFISKSSYNTMEKYFYLKVHYAKIFTGCKQTKNFLMQETVVCRS